jgi:hypothetical protein
LTKLLDYWEERALEEFTGLIGDSSSVAIPEELYPICYGFLFLLERVNIKLKYPAVVIDELEAGEHGFVCKLMPLDADCEIFFDYIKTIVEYMSTACNTYYDDRGRQ